MEHLIEIEGESYEILDSLLYVTMADSFVKNKLGQGHGEAKIYVGNESEKIYNFFDGFDNECFFRKADFEKFLLDAKQEYYEPQQEYFKKDEMKEVYLKLEKKVALFSKGLLNFKTFRVMVKPPRIYIKSKSQYYDFMRSVGLPNISYLSILKIKNKEGKTFYYFKLFIDYKPDVVKYTSSVEAKQEKNIENNDKLNKMYKEKLIKARIGQGEYRKMLIEDCMYCPFTLVNDERLLIASHIKPWAVANNNEKVDCKNGFALTPTYDQLFDKGFITFEDDKSLKVSPWLSPMNQKRLNIYNGKIITKLPLDEKRKYYLKYHRENIFKM